MIRLRKAELEDQEFIGKVCLGTHKLYAPFMGDAFIKQAHKYEDALPSGYHIDIIEDNEKQLGFVGYKRKTEKVMYITAFYLLDIYYGQGYGTKTMNYLVDEFQKKWYERSVIRSS